MKRTEAQAAGLKTYSTGRPCHRGHVAERYVSTGQCVECLREDRKVITPRTAARSNPASLNWQLETLDADFAQRTEVMVAGLAADLEDAKARLDLEHRSRVRKLRDAQDAAREAARRALLAELAAASDRDVHTAEAQAERAQATERAASRQAALAVVKGFKKCRAKIDAAKLDEAASYVWAVALTHNPDVTQDDVSLGRDVQYEDVYFFMMHPDDVAATMGALTAYAPPPAALPVPSVAVPVVRTSSDWLHN